MGSGSLKIVHVITGLETGGAEMMLYKLLREMQKFDNETVVVSLMEDGAVSELISEINIPVYTLGVSQGEVPGFRKIWWYIKLVRKYRPNIIQGWMYHGNIAATIAAFFMGKKSKHYWNVRQTIYSYKYEKSLTRIIVRLSALISRMPNKIIYNSHLSKSQHEGCGFSARNSVVFPNGFDLNEFSPSKKCRVGIREYLKIKGDSIVVGHVARFHPMKGHIDFLRSAGIVLKRYSDIHFVLIGQGVDYDNKRLMDGIQKIPKSENIHLLGKRMDISEIMPSFDIFVSSSGWGEGFPNVVGEAMSSGVPCIVTDVGDSALVVGSSGYVCKPNDSIELAGYIIRMINNKSARFDMSISGLKRIKKYFSIEFVSDKYLSLYCNEAHEGFSE